MDRLEQYIKDNAGRFDTELPPPGSRERFLAALEKESSASKVRKFPWGWISAAVSAAAAVAVVVSVLGFSDVDREIERSISDMSSQEAKLIALVENVCPQEMETVVKSIRSITAEAIPFPDLLPEEIPAKERARIIKEYYSRKTEALQTLMACYDESCK